MVKNTTGGNKAKKQKRYNMKKQPLDKTLPGQMFGQVVDNRGGNHFGILCSDNIVRIGRLGGAARKGGRILAGSFVVVSLREFEKEQKNCDIIGIAEPPHDIKMIFKKINPNRVEDEIEFYDSENEFAEFEESETVNKQNETVNTVTNNVLDGIDEEEINWDDI